MTFINTKEKENVSNSNFQDLISSYRQDPFVGHLSTPITNSKLTRAYLSTLPLYNNELSPLLKGSIIGISHGYFLFGPFTYLGPLRNTDATAFIGFLSALSLLIIVTFFAFLYGHVSLKRGELNESFGFNRTNWNKFLSGFSLGGFTGVSLAYFLTKVLI